MYTQVLFYVLYGERTFSDLTSRAATRYLFFISLKFDGSSEIFYLMLPKVLFG